jgi:membrane-associated phospholipid phosphatase
VWREKYKWMVERPVTVLQRTDPSWSSYLMTPAFPEYPSGHSAVSRAAADVLTSYFGDVAFNDPGYGVTEQSRRQFNVEPRSFTSFRTAADEASDSRLYAGIHYPIGTEGGKTFGACIARGAIGETLAKQG